MGTKSTASVPQIGEDSFRRVVEWAPTAMLMIDGEGHIVLANAQAENVFGYTREQILGEPIEILVPQRFAGHHPPFRKGYLAHPQPRPMGSGRDLFARRRDGSEFPVEIGLNPIDTDGGVMVLASIVDISDRLRAQQKLEKALHEKTVLLNEVHHRVKNNLQVIASLLNLQSNHATDPKVRAILGESQNRVRAMGLTHQLLYERKDYSRIDLGEYLDRLAHLLLGSYREGSTRITLKRELPTDTLHIDLDGAIPCGLTVNEMVTNAFKHAFPEHRAGEICLALGLAEGDLEVVVADNGIGLPADFDLLQVRSLGLQLVPLLVDQLGGRFNIESGAGVRFSLRFPIEPPRSSRS